MATIAALGIMLLTGCGSSITASEAQRPQSQPVRLSTWTFPPSEAPINGPPGWSAADEVRLLVGIEKARFEVRILTKVHRVLP